MRETRFKDTEIGRIPEEWEAKTIDSIGLLKAGKSTAFIEEDKIYPCYGGNGIREYVSYFSYDGVFPIIGRQGALCGNLQLAVGKFHATEHAVVVSVNKDIDPYWAYYALDYANLNQYATGCAQPGLAVKDLNLIKIPKPTKEELSKIGSALTSIDNLISSLDKLIGKKKNIKQATIQLLLTGRKRLKGFTGPWVEQKLQDSFSIIGNNTYSRDELSDSGTVRDVHYGDILIKYGSVIDAASAELPFIKGKETVSHPLVDGDIIMADTAEDKTCGKVCEIRGVENLSIEAGLHTIVLRPNIPYGPCFLGCYMNSSAFHDLLLPLMQGTKVTSISKTALMNVQMMIPSSITEQSEIAKVLVSIDNDITALESKKAKYESIKQGMMQQLLTGKIRLTD